MTPAHRCDAEALELGGGLEVLLAAAIERVSPGEELEVLTPSRSTALELPGWARVAGHEVTGETVRSEGSRRVHAVRIRRGQVRRVLGEPLAERVEPAALRAGRFDTRDLRRGLAPPGAASPSAGLVPLGAIVEEGAPAFGWRLNELERTWADELAGLVERASAAQWDASDDIPWEQARGLPDEVERAVAQVMTYIAQNEYAALYVPGRFLNQVNPAYLEVLLWLASHVHDEARHVEVFTKRALAGGASAYALASTELSLHTLLEEADFTAAALLLNVLGEGTFLDLLRFVELHAPDAASATAARLAHRDERRHVHFGIAHVRRRLESDPAQRERLLAAAEARAAKLVSLDGLSPVLVESLTLMSARSRQPAELSEAASAVRALMARMEQNRIRRLRAAGFDAATARHLSELHTPNLM